MLSGRPLQEGQVDSCRIVSAWLCASLHRLAGKMTPSTWAGFRCDMFESPGRKMSQKPETKANPNASTDMCQDPNGLYLWIQIPTKISKTYKPLLPVIAYCNYIPLLQAAQFCPSAKFGKKCPRSCKDPGTLDRGSERVFAYFHGVQSISSKK